MRTLGKEAATYRFTQDEKRALSGIVYAYKEQGIKTSENEITSAWSQWAMASKFYPRRPLLSSHHT